MGRKLKEDTDNDSLNASNNTKAKLIPPPSPKKNVGQHLRRFSFNNFDPLPLTAVFANTSNLFAIDQTSNSINGNNKNDWINATTQTAIETAMDLSDNLLLLEPRSIEQMRNDPITVEETFAGIVWPTEV